MALAAHRGARGTVPEFASNATAGATIAEFIGSDQELGFYIRIVTGNMRPDLAFAGIFFLAVLGLAIEDEGGRLLEINEVTAARCGVEQLHHR